MSARAIAPMIAKNRLTHQGMMPKPPRIAMMMAMTKPTTLAAATNDPRKFLAVFSGHGVAALHHY